MAMHLKQLPALLAAGCLVLVSGSAFAQQHTTAQQYQTAQQYRYYMQQQYQPAQQAAFAQAPGMVDPAAHYNPACTANGCTAEPGGCAAGEGCCAPGCEPCGSAWSIHAAGVFMKRQRPSSRVFFTEAGNEVFNYDQFNFNYQPGVDISLIGKIDCCQSLELRYFGLWDVDDSRRVGPFPLGAAPNETLFLNADYDSQLHSGEINHRYNCCDSKLTLLGGFRYLNLREEFNGNFEFPDNPEVGFNINSRTSNDLYGFQLGVDAVVLEGPTRRFRVNALAKGGVYYAHSENQVSIAVTDPNNPANNFFSSNTDTLDGVAFVGEAGLLCSYQVTCNTSIQLGYQLLWLQDVAVASEQFLQGSPISPVDNDAGLLYHGINGGLVINF